MRRLREMIKAQTASLVAPLARSLGNAGITANQVTLAGFAVSLAGALLVAAGWFAMGGLLYLLGAVFDLLDGVLARETDQTSDFGAFLDSTLDRVTEGVLFAGLAFHFAAAEEAWLAALTVLALMGAYLTSYTRARAEGLGYSCEVGLISRPERVLIIGVGLIAGLAAPAIWVLVLLGAFTTLQRVVHVWKQAGTARPDENAM